MNLDNKFILNQNQLMDGGKGWLYNTEFFNVDFSGEGVLLNIKMQLKAPPPLYEQKVDKN